MAAFAELYMDQGADFNLYLDIADDDTGVPQNLTGYTISSQIRKSYYAANATANLICTILDAANGNVWVYLSAANTSLIKPDRYVYDIEMRSNSNSTIRLVEGIITITPEVTR